jgi:hypothetical protein
MTVFGSWEQEQTTAVVKRAFGWLTVYIPSIAECAREGHRAVWPGEENKQRQEPGVGAAQDERLREPLKIAELLSRSVAVSLFGA